MRINLRNELNLDIETIVKMFIEDGWVQEDEAYILKDCGIETHPGARNVDYRTKLSITFSPELLHYSESHTPSTYDLSKAKKTLQHTTTPWIKGSILIRDDETVTRPSDNERLREVAKWLKTEILKMPIKPFHDEDAYMGYFKRPEKTSEFIRLSFYMNPSYPEGYWQNHTIE